MNNTNKGKAKNILAWCCLPMLLLLTYHFEGFAKIQSATYNYVHQIRDTPPPVFKTADSIKITTPAVRTPSMSEEKKKTVDTVFAAASDTFNFKTSKDSLSSIVIYHADDSMVIDVPAQKMYLYGKISSVNYEDNSLSAPQIEFNQKTNLVSAFLKKDSVGRVLSYPFFSQKDFQSVSDTIRFDMKSGRGLTKGTYTKQGEMFVYGEKIKKADTSVFYALNGRFTTCNLDTPHYAFIAKKVKFVNKKWAYTGPVHPEFEGVPLPISLPFGIFPLTQGRHSGLLAPSFAADAQRGLALENLGYYKIISPNWDVVTRGTLYSYGSWNLSVNPRYFRRYHYQGNIAVSVQNFHPLDEPNTRTINLQWSHNADTKSRPGVNFTANVNAGSTKYNSQVPTNANLNFQNQLNSSITYSKVWKNKPYNISVSANHNQNSISGLTNLNLPDIAFNVNTLYPFRRKEPIGDYKWFENLGIAYNGNTKSLTSFFDTAGNLGGQILDNLQYGAQHSIPITLALPPLGVLQLAPSVSYQEQWYQRKIERQFNRASNKIDTVLQKDGLYTARQMSFGLSASTRLFGLFGFSEKSRVKAIRHEIRPSLSMNYSPNFNANNYYNSTYDAAGNKQPVSYFDGSIYGPYGNQRFGGLSFNIDNNITAKIRDRKDTSAKADKKVSLLDGLGLSGSYNFLADSFQFSTIALQARTNLFEKVNISGQATFDPYQTNAQGRRIDRLVLKDKISLGNLVSGGVQLQTSFKGGDQTKKKQQPNINKTNSNIGNASLDESQQEAAYIQNNPSEFADFSVPWNVDLSYSLLINRQFDFQDTRFKTNVSQGVTFNAAANLTAKWKVGMNGSFDVTTKKLGLLSAYLSRDLHCWQMGINLSPVGRSRYFSINISPKSPILRDLKVNRTRSFTDF
ncbi:MAG: putative LPS assembly protein LptD [Ferruginibacter sp.]